ncbi:response regulator [Stutzerimonas zhaodongensis]|uniref:histidine kinase n=1 Tax=Stutzerimonas zhaodongensis TaxID=1176257 RepID=A0A3M2HRE6_9GAMM|nr:MHYT domain-containing protein [Stutzerimonas zhaodongensis]MCQ2028476.1 ATP-binding protein [Stutzerimonas zhaodongensis]MCQ4317436.1 ATP-binding protein [Stutzerimonas zhaodongensis]RMH89909.1 response regulator [Stutzerimonas zhaodongensis]
MHTTYNLALVALSILIAVAGSFTALDLAGRSRVAHGWPRHVWLAAAAACMGLSIWSMHFIGMLALGMPGMDIQYDLGLTALSFFVPILVTAISFFAVGARSNLITLGVGGLFMGLGIGAMHYIGMEAMTLHAELSYDRAWVALSFGIAIGASTVALWLSDKGARPLLQGVSAVAMGFAIAGMHYAAMAGARFAPLDADMPMSGQGLDLMTLASAVSGATFIVLYFGLAASMHDRRKAMISEREASSLRLSEERFRELYSKTPLPLHSLDSDGRLASVSDTWLALVGYRREDVLGRHLVSFMTEASARQMLEHDWPLLLETGECLNAEYRLVARAGIFVDVLASTRIEEVSGGSLILGGLVNISERRQAEAALRQAQKMEAVGKLTGGIAHDFNNLLAVVAGNLELLRKRVPRAEGRIEHLIENALLATRRGEGLVQRLLTFARKQELRPSSVSLPDLVMDMRELLQRSVDANITVDMRFPLNLPPAYVDANQLEMVLINLVVNARDAMPNGGAICIEGQCRSATLEGKDCNREYVVLVVCDNGCGMTPEILARATEPFFTTKGPGKGTGLGLSMAHGLAEQSGGRLQVHSTPEKGTTIELWLPLSTMSAEKHDVENSENSGNHAHALAVPPRASLTVLVVDDDALVLENTSALLEDLGYSVTAVDSALAALSLLRGRSHFDILVTDHMMPGMTGAQLADTLQTERPGLPVLLVSGYADLTEGNRRRHTLAKPFTQASLVQAMNQVMNRPNPGVVVELYPSR